MILVRYISILLVLQALPLAAVAATADDVVCNGCVNPGDLAPGAVVRSRIGASAVGPQQLGNNSVNTIKLLDRSVTARKIRNRQVTLPKLSLEVQNLLTSANGFSVDQFTGVDVAVAGVGCPGNTIPVSANCACDDNDGNNNFGILIACQIASDGAFGGCIPDAITLDTNLPFPLVEVTAVCGSQTGQQAATVGAGMPGVEQELDRLRRIQDRYAEKLNQ